MVKYFGEFDDIDNNRIRVEINIDGAVGEAIELTIADPSITIDYNSENIFQPLKKSGASISLLVPNVIESLFTGELLNPRVSIYKNNELFWFGYITPNIYTQPYKDTLDLLTIECVDTISNLANMDYQKSSEISSFINIITSILGRTNTACSKLYIPTTVALNNDTDILGNLYIQERNFFDEKEVPEKCDEVVSEILKYLGFQMLQYKDSFYIIDNKNLVNGNNTFLEYNLSTSATSTVTLDLSSRNVNDIGIAVGNGTVALDGVYNKVTVIANNNPLGTILPELDDEDDLENQNTDKQHYESGKTYTYNDTTYRLLTAYFNSKNNWSTQSLYQYSGDFYSPTVTEITEVTNSILDNGKSNLEGVLFQKAAYYDESDGEPSKVNWQTYLTFIRSYIYGGTHAPYLTLRNTKSMVFDGGYLIINLKYKLSTELYPHGIIKSEYDSFSTYGYYDKNWSSSVDEIGSANWPNYTMFQCRLKIGDSFWNGEQWIKQSDYDEKISRWNSIYMNYRGIDAGNQTHYWFRVWNDYNEWEYVTESQYNSFSGTKESGACPYAHSRYNYRYDSGDNVYVWVTDEFYYERYYGNYCFLIRKNKVNDPIMDTEYQLTNTVSYKFKIIDSIDGIAIPIDVENPLNGNIEFTLYEPTSNLLFSGILGIDPQHQQSKPNGTCRAIHISDLVMKYTKTNSNQDIFNMNDVDPDVIYTNTVNSSYCQELEDIELRVNTANENAVSYSYVMGKSGNNYYYPKQLTFNGNTVLPEQKVIDRYVSYYSSPKYKYSNTLRNNNVTPFSLITETNLNKTMIVNRASYDLSNNRVEIELNQI